MRERIGVREGNLADARLFRGQVYARQEFHHLPSAQIADVISTLCQSGPSAEISDHVAIAKDIWGSEEVDRRVAGRAPTELGIRNERGAIFAPLQQGTYESIAQRSFENVQSLVFATE